MHPIRRSCSTPRRTSQFLAGVLNGQGRAFSRSATLQRGALPVYLEASSAELSATLARLNSKVLLPELLTDEQKKLVFKQENRSRIEAEPIEITLGDVTLPLEHINRMRDQPNRWQTVRSVVESSETAQDWENVLRMMQGFENAGIHVKREWQEKIVRRLNTAGMQHLVLKALQRASATGLRLRHPAIIQKVFYGLHQKASASGWEGGETRKALNMAEQCVELMEGEEHLGRREVTPDPRASPFVIAVPAGLAAKRAKRHTGGEDKDGKVKKYVTRLANALRQDGFLDARLPAKLAHLEPPARFKNRTLKLEWITEAKTTLAELLVLWNALRFAREVLGADMPQPNETHKAEKHIHHQMMQALEKLRKVASTDFNHHIAEVVEGIKRCEKA